MYKGKVLKRLEKSIVDETVRIREQRLLGKSRIEYKFKQLHLIDGKERVELVNSNKWIKEKDEYIDRLDVLEIIKSLSV